MAVVEVMPPYLWFCMGCLKTHFADRCPISLKPRPVQLPATSGDRK